MGLLTPPGICAFPNLFQPRAAAQGADPRYSLILLFDAAAQATPEYKAMRRAALEAITDEWGQAKANDPAFVKSLRLPFRDAAEKNYNGFEPGMVYIQPWSKNKPGVVDEDVADIIDPSVIFPGAMVRAYVNFFTYNQSGNKGVSVGLTHVQLMDRSTPRLDGRKAADQVFSAVPKANAAPVMAAADDDDFPF